MNKKPQAEGTVGSSISNSRTSENLPANPSIQLKKQLDNIEIILIDDSEESEYKGPYPIDQLNLVRDCLKTEFVDAPCRSRAEFHLKLKLGIINDQIIDFFKHGKLPHDLVDEFDTKEIYPDEIYEQKFG